MPKNMSFAHSRMVQILLYYVIICLILKQTIMSVISIVQYFIHSHVTLQKVLVKSFKMHMSYGI